MKDEKYDPLLDEDKFDVVTYIRELWFGLVCVINGVVVGCSCFIIGYNTIILVLIINIIFFGLIIFLFNLFTKLSLYSTLPRFKRTLFVYIIIGCALLLLAMFKINVTVAVIFLALYLFEIIVYATVPGQTKVIVWVKKKLKKGNKKG